MAGRLLRSALHVQGLSPSVCISGLGFFLRLFLNLFLFLVFNFIVVLFLTFFLGLFSTFVAHGLAPQ